MKYRSLRNSIFLVLMSFSIIMGVLCVLILALSNNLFSTVQQRMLDQYAFSEYFHQADDVQSLLLSQFTNDSADKDEALRASLVSLQKTAQDMHNAFASPQFTDLAYLTASYVDVIRQFMDISGSSNHAALLEAYNQAQHIHKLIAGQQRHLNTAMETIASESINTFSQTWQHRLMMMTFCVALVSIFLLLAGMHFVQRTIAPITQLTKSAEAMAGSNLHVELPAADRQLDDEVQVLIRSFTLMAATIRKQMQQLEEKITLTKELHALEMQNMQMQVSLSNTERLFMQSLVNPHFLFNCLTTLASLAYMEKAPNVRDASNQIAHYLRQSLERIGKEVTIAEELAHIRGYISIQQLRFASRICFCIACEESCETALLPAIILQPLVENAISHGVGSYLQGGRVTIEIHREDGKIALSVRDNGVGIPPERIQQIQEDLGTPFDTRKTGIGFRSVYSRMHAYFKDEMTYTIQSVPSETMISFLFPG